MQRKFINKKNSYDYFKKLSDSLYSFRKDKSNIDKAIKLLKIPLIEGKPRLSRVTKFAEGSFFICYKAYLRTETKPVWDMPVYVLIPTHKRGLFPLLVILQVHGPGAAAAFNIIDKKLFPHIDRKFCASHNFGYALEAVKKGFAVIVPEMRGVGELRDPEAIAIGKKLNFPWPASYSCASHEGRLLHLGRTLLGMRVYDVLSIIRYLKEGNFSGEKEIFKNFNASRIGIVGHSGGSPVALFSALIALKNIKAVCLSGYFGTFRESILSMQHCACNYVPELGKVIEMPELVSGIAPKPLLIASGKADDIFPIQAAIRGKKIVENAYQRLNASKNFKFYTVPDKQGKRGHRFPEGNYVFDWFRQVL